MLNDEWEVLWGAASGGTAAQAARSASGRNLAMIWRTMFGPTTGRILFVFGIAVTVGALVSAMNDLDALVPGLIVGIAWTAVGAKRGLPLFVTSRDRNEAARQIRTRRRFLLGGILMTAVLNVVVLSSVSHAVTMTAFMLVALPAVVPFCVLALSECPHCHRHIAAGFGRRSSVVPFIRCVHCGGRLGDARSDQADRRRAIRH